MIIGSAEVVVRAVTTGIEAEIKKALASARTIARDEGKLAGRNYTDAFTQQVSFGMPTAVQRALRTASTSVADVEGQRLGQNYGKGFERQVTQNLKNGVSSGLGAAGSDAGQHGQRIGDQFVQSFSRPVNQGLRTAVNDGLGGVSGAGLGQALGRSVVGGIRDAVGQGGNDRDFEASGRRSGSAFRRGFRNVLDKLVEPGAQFLSGGFAASFGAAQESFRSMYRTAAVLGPAIAQLLSGISALVSGLGLVVLAASQAAGSLAVLPGLLSAVAQAGIVAAIASKGVGEAIGLGFKSGADTAVKNGKAIANAANSAADKARAVTRAQEALSRAYEDNARRSRDALQRVADAEENLNGAQQEVLFTQLKLNAARDAGAESLQQLGFSAEGAALDEQRAAFQLQDALDELAKVQDQPVGTRIRDEAELAFKEAELQYRESKDRAQDLAKAQEEAAKSGVEGTEEVVDAKNDIADAEKRAADAAEQLRDAQEAQSDVARQNARAIQDAEQGINDALQNQAEAYEKLAEAGESASTAADDYKKALEDLAPSQRSFVEAVVASAETWKSFRKELGQNLFEGFDDAFRRVTELVTVDLREGLAETASIVGELGRNIVNALTLPENVRGLKNIIAGNNDILDLWNQTSITGKTSMENLITVFIRLGQAIQPVTKKFMDWVTQVVDGWAVATDPARGNGDVLVDFFNRSGNVAAAFGETFGNVFASFKNILKGAQGPIDDFLKRLIVGTQRLEDFTEIKLNDNSIKDFFDDILDNAGSVIGLFKEIAIAFLNIGRNNTLQRTFDQLAETIRTKFAAAFEQLTKIGPFLADAFDELLRVIIAIGENQGMKFFFLTLKNGFKFIADLIEGAEWLKTAIDAMGRIGGTLIALGLLSTALQFIGKVVLAFPAQVMQWIAAVKGTPDAGTRMVRAQEAIATSAGATNLLLQEQLLLMQRLATAPIPAAAGVGAAAAGSAAVGGAAVGGLAASQTRGAVILPSAPVVPPVVVPAGAADASREVTNMGNAATTAGGKFAAFGKIIGTVLKGALTAIPLVGIAIFGIITVLEMFGDTTEDDSKKTEEFNDNVKEVQETLEKTTGALTANTRAWVLNKLATTDSLKVANKYGIDVGLLVAGIEGVDSAFEKSTDSINENRLEILHSKDDYGTALKAAQAYGLNQEQLDHMLLTGEGLPKFQTDLNNAERGVFELGKEFPAVIGGAEAVGTVGREAASGLKELDGVEGDLIARRDELAEAHKLQVEMARAEVILAGDLAGAVGDTAGAYADLIPTVGDATEKQEDWNTEADKSSQVVDNVIAALDRLNGKVPTTEEAMRNYGETIDNAFDGFKKLENGSLDLSEALLTQEGAFDLSNETGRNYFDMTNDLQKATIESAQAAFEAAGGVDNLEEAQAAANKAAQMGYDDFIRLSGELGVGKEQAEALAKQYGLMPSDVVTTLTTETRKAETDLAKFQLDAEGKVIGIKIDPNTPVAKDQVDKFRKDAEGNIYMPVDPNLSEADKKLGQFVLDQSGMVIGFQVKPNIAPAQNILDGLIRDAQGKPIGMAIDVNSVQAGADVSKFVLDAEGKPIGIKIDPKDKEATKIVDGWITDNTGKKIAMVSDPLSNDPTSIVEGWINTDHGSYNVFAETNTAGATEDITKWRDGTFGSTPNSLNTYKVYPNTNPADADKQVTDWLSGVNNNPGIYTYDLHPNTNSAPEPGSESSGQVGDWIAFNDKENKRYALHPNTNSNPQVVNEATTQVDNWITKTDADGKEYLLVPNTQSAPNDGSPASQQVIGWVTYINGSGQEVTVPVKATVQTQVAPPGTDALNNIWSSYFGVGSPGFGLSGIGVNATGGYIRGPGGPTDDRIPSWLSDKEYVIKASAVKRLGVPLLNMLNAGVMPNQWPRFAGGGQAARTMISSGTSSKSRKKEKYDLVDVISIDGKSYGAGNRMIDNSMDPFVSGAIGLAMQEWVNPFEDFVDKFNEKIIAGLGAGLGAIVNFVKGKSVGEGESPVATSGTFDINAPSGHYNMPLPTGRRGAFLQAMATKMGTSYVWGAAGPNVFDCSGLISWALENAGAGQGRKTADDFWRTGGPKMSSPAAGDLVLFGARYGRSGMAGHIGAVIGQGLMMHTYDTGSPATVSPYKSWDLANGGPLGYVSPIPRGESSLGGPFGQVMAFITKMGGFFTPTGSVSGAGEDITGGGAGGETRLMNSVDPIEDGGPMNMSRSRPEWIGPIPPGPALDRWRPIYTHALNMIGQFSNEALSLMMNQMRSESSGDPTSYAIDSNFRAGHPSKGLLQTIPGTFRANAYPGYTTNIWDPLSNALASLRYVLKTYGSFARGYRGVAYDTGGMLNHMGAAFNMSGKPERILDPRQTVAFESLVNAITQTNGSTALSGSGALSGRDIALIKTVAEQVAAQRGDTHVRVFIGQTELTDIIDAQVTGYDYGTARAVAIGRKP